MEKSGTARTSTPRSSSTKITITATTTATRSRAIKPRSSFSINAISKSELARQPQRHCRHVGDERKHGEKRDEVRPQLLHDLAHRLAADARHGVQAQPHWRRHQPDHQVEDHDDPKVLGRDPDL